MNFNDIVIEIPLLIPSTNKTHQKEIPWIEILIE